MAIRFIPTLRERIRKPARRLPLSSNLRSFSFPNREKQVSRRFAEKLREQRLPSKICDVCGLSAITLHRRDEFEEEPFGIVNLRLRLNVRLSLFPFPVFSTESNCLCFGQCPRHLACFCSVKCHVGVWNLWGWGRAWAFLVFLTQSASSQSNRQVGAFPPIRYRSPASQPMIPHHWLYPFNHVSKRRSTELRSSPGILFFFFNTLKIGLQ